MEVDTGHGAHFQVGSSESAEVISVSFGIITGWINRS
jgi:hypothetical protein